MAINTADKRSSAINIGSPWRGMLPLPDAAIDFGDRQHIVFLYRGIVADGGGSGGGDGGFTFPVATRASRRVSFVVAI